MSRPYTAPAIRRAVDVLEYLATFPGPVRLSDVARGLDCGKSTVLGILRTLEDVGWVEKDSSGVGYCVGAGLLALTRKAFGAREVAEIARPLLEKVAERGGESAFLGLLRQGRIAIEASVEGGHEMCIAARPGGSLPFFAGATGKVFLAGMDPVRARGKVTGAPLPRFTDRTITDPEQFLGEVSRARELGYATDDEEYLRGVRAVAAPVRRGGETVGALWVAGFSTRLTDERLALVRAELLEAARVCSALLESANGR
ncbi:MAG: IclR family transcriptional regulator [Deferrisomatales bacterium]|nr:IclR family transcriptional regulator [Deferrisomatales bacterium]